MLWKWKFIQSFPETAVQEPLDWSDLLSFKSKIPLKTLNENLFLSQTLRKEWSICPLNHSFKARPDKSIPIIPLIFKWQITFQAHLGWRMGLKDSVKAWSPQLSNLWWMANSVSKGFDTARRTGSSRRFKRYPTTYRWVSSRLPLRLILVYPNPQ